MYAFRASLGIKLREKRAIRIISQNHIIILFAIRLSGYSVNRQSFRTKTTVLSLVT